MSPRYNILLNAVILQLFRFYAFKQLLSERNFNLKRFRYALNLISPLWACFLCVACYIRTEYPVTGSNMNYDRRVLHP